MLMLGSAAQGELAVDLAQPPQPIERMPALPPPPQPHAIANGQQATPASSSASPTNRADTGRPQLLHQPLQPQQPPRAAQPPQPQLHSANARANAALTFAERIYQFAVAQPTTKSLHLAWFLVSKSVSHALSYDARLVPSQVLGCVAGPVSQRVTELARLILQRGELSPQQHAQISLPGCYGGFGLRHEAIGLCADAAFWAAWVGMKQRVSLLTAAIGMGPLQCTGTAEATQARQRLGAAGVSVDTLGAVSFTSAAAAEYEGGPWHKDTPTTQLGSLALQQQTPPSQEDALPGGLLSRLPKRFASRIFRHLEALTATRVWRAHPQHRRESMLSSGGPGAGVIWQGMPRTAEHYFPSGHFRVASLRRLGAISAPANATCPIPIKASTGQEQELCGQLLDASLEHSVICKYGPARMRPHRYMAAELVSCLGAAGAEIDLERTVIELAQSQEDGTIREAALDLYVLFPGSTSPFYIDVTIRCPTTPGFAAAQGVLEKAERYGTQVIAVSIETYGRFATGSIAGLDFLAARAADQ